MVLAPFCLMAFTRCRRSSPALQSSYRPPQKCKSAGTVGGVRGRRRAARLFLGKACYVAPPPFRVLGVVRTISAAVMMRRDYAGCSKETRRCRRLDERAGIEPWILQQMNALPMCPGRTNPLPKGSSLRSSIPKPPVGGGRMPACLSPLVFEIGDRCRRGSDPEQPKDKDAVWESLCEERA